MFFLAVALLASIIGGANVHIFVFTDLKNNRFQQKVMMQKTICEYSPLSVIAERNLEGGGTWLTAEGAIHLERSELIGLEKF